MKENMSLVYANQNQMHFQRYLKIEFSMTLSYSERERKFVNKNIKIHLVTLVISPLRKKDNNFFQKLKKQEIG